MYRGTYDKIEANASYLKKIHAEGRLENFELFDEPFKTAIQILDCGNMDHQQASQYLGISTETVKQVRRALGI